MSESPLKIHNPCLGWDVQPLQALTILIKDGTHGTHERVSEGIPLLSAKNITASGQVTLDESDSRVSERDYRLIHASYEIERDDILLTVVGTLGRSALVNGAEKFTIQRSVAVIRADARKVQPDFLRYTLCDDYFQKQLSIRSNATAQAGVYLGELSSIEIQSPPLDEQRKITKILSTIDNLIEKTQALVDKYQSIKQGMMHDLFTRGVDENGQLRPSYEEAPHLYKESELGWIPKEWEVELLHNLTTKIIDGTHHTPIYTESGVPFLRVTDVQVETINLKEVKFISEAEHFQLIKRCNPERGDILYSKNGTIGIPKIVDWDWEFSVFVSLALIKPIHEMIQVYYLEFLLGSFPVWTQIRKRAKQGTVTNLHLEEIREFLIPLPCMEEQVEISKRLAAIDSKLLNEKKSVDKYEKLKSGLMQDLLTGKVRVAV
jgi:type I restriction enzyme S subunit